MPIVITGEKSAHSEVISQDCCWSISSRIRTDASIAWPMSGYCTDGYRGSLVRTPNLGNIVQELVNQDAWQADNPMLFIFEPDTDTINRHMNFYDYQHGVPEYVAELTIYVNPVSTIDNLQKAFSAFLYPNPAEYTRIKWVQQEAGSVSWNIYDGAGSMLLQNEQYFQSGVGEIDLMEMGELPRGVYVIEVFDDFHLPVSLKWIKI
ncbi:MAG TPA: T9SS type A sorting domain-containing protein [Saprospiraceae bacterium]|nr:T9SS type A sorting domain-containing protein [Saprospiraceae bacterium]HMQ81749.1 T9SS type A sorting domain-containing protein [Saprospiraceae bacterium]